MDGIANPIRSVSVALHSQMALLRTLFAVGQPVLEVEGRVGEDLAAVGAHEALGVERPAHRLQAVLKFK